MRQALVGLLLLLACTPLAPLGAAPAPAKPPLVVLAYETKPFFYRDDAGQPAGFEHDILRYYAKAQGQELQVIWAVKFELMLERVAQGETAVGAGTFTVTSERQRRVDFSAPYFPVRVMLVEPRAQTTRDLADLRGATLATIKGTTYEELLSAVPDAKMVYAVTEEELLRLVASGAARAAAADSAIVLDKMRRFPTLKLGIALSPEQGLAFAVPKGSLLRDELSRHLVQLKAGQIYYRLLEKHFGAEAAQLVAAGREQ